MERAAKAQSIAVKLENGETYRMDFDMAALANAEGIFEDKFGKSVGVDAIIADLVQAKARAMMAFAYGAMLSAGEKISWEDFSKSVYTFENYNVLADAVTTALLRMMRPEAGEGSAEKNADSRGAS